MKTEYRDEERRGKEEKENKKRSQHKRETNMTKSGLQSTMTS
jgi:hypothetical protein